MSRKKNILDLSECSEADLRGWYLNEVGYDPKDDDPGMTITALRKQVGQYCDAAGIPYVDEAP